MELFDWLKDRIRKCITPRQNTDMESEILNIVSAPIYVYTITSVYYYSLFYVMPYHFPSSQNASRDVPTSNGEEYQTGLVVGDWCSKLFLHRALLSMVYFQMMTNWACIRFVGNRLELCQLPKTSNVNETEQATEIQQNNQSTRKENRRHNPKGDKKRLSDGRSTKPGSEPRRSYWAWNMCRKCDHESPPRCHHCPMCETCVLKRDHHCFFSGRCVGFYNQRYFIVFLIWAVFGTSYSTLYFIPYLRNDLWYAMSGWDLVPPFALIRWLFGTGSGFITAVMFTFMFNALFVFLSLTFLVEQYSLTCSGLTQFETKGLNRRKLNIEDERDFGAKVRAVMGRNYGLCLLVPLTHVFLPPCENPYEWPELKIHRFNGKDK